MQGKNIAYVQIDNIKSTLTKCKTNLILYVKKYFDLYCVKLLRNSYE